MNEQQQLMASVTRRILSDHCSTELLDQAEQGQYPEALWTLLEERGLQPSAGLRLWAEAAVIFAMFWWCFERRVVMRCRYPWLKHCWV